MYLETRTRALIKTLSWRLLATLATIALVYLFVGKIQVAVVIGGIEVLIKLLLYYFHERLWNLIQIGKDQAEPFVLWFTGLSGSGKSTLAQMTLKKLKDMGYKVEHLDGDTIRSIFPSTGFTKEDRDHHIKRVGYIASLLEKQGTIVICSFISPYKETRNFVRSITNNFVEVYVSASLEICERRDPKGLYKKARSGEIKNFTGVDDPYEVPENPEITIKTDEMDVNDSVKKIIGSINRMQKYTFN